MEKSSGTAKTMFWSPSVTNNGVNQTHIQNVPHQNKSMTIKIPSKLNANVATNYFTKESLTAVKFPPLNHALPCFQNSIPPSNQLIKRQGELAQYGK
jgi:hypothetical protein